MHRSLIYIGLFVSIMCGMGLAASQSTSYMSLLLPSGVGALFNLILSIVLIHFAIFDLLRKPKIKAYLGYLGWALIALSFIGFVYPTYFGVFYGDANPINLTMMIVNGFGFLIAKVDYEHESSLGKQIKKYTGPKLEIAVKLFKKIQTHLANVLHIFI